MESQLLHSMAFYSLTPTQQKVQWWCSSVTQGLSQRERWQQCVGGMVSGPPTQEVSPVAPDPHRCLQRHPYWPQVLHAVDRVYWQLIIGFWVWVSTNLSFLLSFLFSNAQDFLVVTIEILGLISGWLLFFSILLHNVNNYCLYSTLLVDHFVNGSESN